MARQIINIQNKLKMKLGDHAGGFRLATDGLSHIIGENAAIKFADESSRTDFEAINEILTHKKIRHWMDDAEKLSWNDYRHWAGNHTDQSFLFTVHDSRLENIQDIKKIRGFVNLYSEKGEKFRVKRMAKLKIIENPENKHFLEFSMALRPKKNQTARSGLMSSALRQSCLQVKTLLNKKDSELIIFGFINPENTASIKAIQAAGFIKKGKAKYDSTSEEESDVYILSWRKLKKIIKLKMEIGLRKKMKVIFEPQITDSHCGPAVVKALLGYNGIQVTQDQVVEASKSKSRLNKHGMGPAQISLAVDQLSKGLKFLYKQDATSRDLERLIKFHKLPVVVNWQGLFYNSAKDEKKHKLKTAEYGHYSVVVDINPKKDEIVIDDPYREYFEIPRVFSYKWFKTRWFDRDEIFDKKKRLKKVISTKKLLFIIVPQDVKLPEDLDFKGVHDLPELESIVKY